MDPLTGAGTLATLVGLIGQYKSSRDAASGKDFDRFLIWLIQSGQDELKAAIEANLGTTVSIKALLNTQRSDFVERLARIESALAGFASSVEGFESLAASTSPNSLLSKQALDLLRFYESSGSGKLLELKLMRRTEFHSLDASGGWAADEPRFIEDDLRQLVSLGLLNIDHNQKGERIFHFTRRASDLLKATEPNN
jgi:hypothetical protein